jgi:phage shock protein PspC (stress-responsive transcriptional regulator)
METNSQPAPALDRLFSSLRRSPVIRSDDRVIAGVCSGIAQRTGVSTGLVRLGAVVLAVLGLGVALYLAAWLLLPGVDGRIRLEQALRDGDVPSVVLLVVTLVTVVPDVLLRPHTAWVPLLVIGIVAFAVSRNRCQGRRSTWGQHSAPTGPAPTSYQGPTGPDGQPQDAPRT